MAKATYRGAGVDIDEGDRLVDLIQPLAARTRRSGTLGGLGGFGGLFALPSGYREPVLVAGTDGVGTKLKIAFATDRHRTVGIDLVAMSVNDVCVTGAKPLFFLDYYATSGLKAQAAAQVIEGIAEGCLQADCTLLGGETAELPGFYAPGEYDLAGFAVGVVERSEILDGSRVAVGDAIVGLASTGLHSNGYSLARQIFFERAGLKLDQRVDALEGETLADVLLTPTRIYARAAAALRSAVPLRALAHITGGGLPENLPRVLPQGFVAELHRGAWPLPPVFDLLQKLGDVEDQEMYRTFNMGIGLCAIVPPESVARAIDCLAELNQPAFRIGEVVAGSFGGRTVGPLVDEVGVLNWRLRRLGVLVSGNGSNLQALLEAAQRQQIPPVGLVVANVACRALERAQAAGVPHQLIEAKRYPSRESFEDDLVAALRQAQVELVCLAGFMRLLSSRLLEAFPGAVLNIHPSLLPAFPGLHAQRQALAAGVRIAGCTVHFVDAGTDTGRIVGQIAVPVSPLDDEATLAACILSEEHRLYPAAVRWVASGRIAFSDGRLEVTEPAAPVTGRLASPALD